MNEPRQQSAANPSQVGSGVTVTVFAALALVATSFAQALAPALRGSATGIAQIINLTSFVAACTSQLVAAGGIALCLRLLGSVLPWPSLGVAFRIVIVPITIGVVALTVASAAQPIDPDLGRVVAIATIVAMAAAGPLLWPSLRTRGFGLVLLLAALGATADLAAYELARRAAGSPGWPSSVGALAAATGLGLDVSAAALAYVWVAQGRRRAWIGLAAVGGVALLAAVLGQVGAHHAASGTWVVLNRSLAGLADRPLLNLPPLIANTFALAPVLFAALLLFSSGKQAELRAGLALILLGRTVTGAPAAALLSIGGVLAALAKLVEWETPQRGAPSSSQSALSTDRLPSTTTR